MKKKEQKIQNTALDVYCPVCYTIYKDYEVSTNSHYICKGCGRKIANYDFVYVRPPKLEEVKKVKQ